MAASLTRRRREKNVRQPGGGLRFISEPPRFSRRFSHQFMDQTSPTVPESVVHAPHPTASGRTPLSARAALLSVAAAIAVPVVFVLTLLALLGALNYNILDWME